MGSTIQAQQTQHRHRGRRLAGAAIAAMLSVFVADDARAFTIGSPISDPCHEKISLQALQNMALGPAGQSLLFALPLTQDQAQRVSALGLDLPPGAGFVAASILAGVRWNDLMGNDPIDLLALNQVHNSDLISQAHCIRSTDEDEPAGTRRALDRCRAYIESELANAMAVSDSSAPPGEPLKPRSPSQSTSRLRASWRSSIPCLAFISGGRCTRSKTLIPTPTAT